MPAVEIIYRGDGKGPLDPEGGTFNQYRWPVPFDGSLESRGS
jgi:hypothetical protein